MFKSITHKLLVALVGLLILVTIITGALVYHQISSVLTTTQKTTIHNLTIHISHHLNSVIFNYELLIEKIALEDKVTEYVHNGNKKILEEYLSRFSNQFNELAYINSDGIAEVRIVNGNISDDHNDLSDTPIFLDALWNTNKTVTTFSISPRQQAVRFLEIAFCVEIAGDFSGMILAKIPDSIITDKMQGLKFGETGFIFLFDKEGRILLQADPRVTATKLYGMGPQSQKIVEKALGFQSGVDQGNLLGIESFIAYHPVLARDWGIMSVLPIQEFTGPLVTLQKIFISALLLIIPFGILASLLLAGGITSPIKKLAQAARQISDGSWPEPIYPQSSDEVGLLAETFNSMLKRMKEMLDARDKEINHRIIIEHQLIEAKEQAESLNQAKGQFLANISHEIRTPLNGIVGMTELALSQALSDDQRQYLNMARLSANRLMALINDILDFSKIEAHRLLLESIPFNLHNELTEIVELHSVEARAKNLAMHLDIAPEIPEEIIGDPVRLRQVLVNLIANAIKFTEKGAINITVNLQNETAQNIKLHVLVSDTGIGIPPDKHRIIFQSFTQADGSMSRKYGGTGLGLTIAAQLVEMMSGNIWVESIPNQGSVFHFTALFDKTCDRVPATSKVVQTVSVTGPEYSLKGLHILLAEDEYINSTVVKTIIEQRAGKITIVDTGRKAVDACRHTAFDLILMDIQMPEMDGIAATRAIRELEKDKARHVPIIALTAHAQFKDQRDCLAAGMDDFLIKPVNLEKLFTVITRHLS